MKKLLVVVDYQNDFVDGALGFEKAKTLERGIVGKIDSYISNGDSVLVTYDTHNNNYLNTREGKNLPVPHCIFGTEGHKLYGKLNNWLGGDSNGDILHLQKETFGISPLTMYDLIERFRGVESIEVIGIVTNMCVISNVITFQSTFPKAQMVVDASLCASFDDEMHEKALDVMESMQVKIINREVK